MLPVSKVKRTLSKMMPVSEMISEIPPPTKSLSEIGIGAAKKTAKGVRKVGKAIAVPIKRVRDFHTNLHGREYDDIELSNDDVERSREYLKQLKNETARKSYLDPADEVLRKHMNPDAINFYDSLGHATKRQRTEDEFTRREKEEKIPELPLKLQPLLEEMAQYAIDAYAHIYYHQALNAGKTEKAAEYAERLKFHDDRGCHWLYSLNHDLLNTGDDPNSPRQGFVEFDPVLDAIIISFKGTVFFTAYSDAATDAHATKSSVSSIGNVDFPFILKLHTGFYNRFMDLFPSLMDGFNAALKEYEKVNAEKAVKTPPKVYITGHSLGGALATICAVFFALMFPTFDIYLFAFEPPRSFTSKTMDELNHYEPIKRLYNNTIRTVNDKDIVTGVPTHWMGFSHFGDAFRLPNKASIFKPFSKVMSSHFMENVMPSIKDVANKGLTIHPSHGSGKLRKNDADMKAKMAYVRSFRKTGSNSKKKTSRLLSGW